MLVLYASGSLTLCTQIYRELAPLDRARSQRIKLMLLSHLRLLPPGHRGGAATDPTAAMTALVPLHPLSRTGRVEHYDWAARQRLCARTATSSLSCPVQPHPPSARSRRVLPLVLARWGGERGLPLWGGRRGQPWERARRNPARLGERKGRSWEGGRIGGADARVERKRGESWLVFFYSHGSHLQILYTDYFNKQCQIII